MYFVDYDDLNRFMRWIIAPFMNDDLGQSFLGFRFAGIKNRFVNCDIRVFQKTGQWDCLYFQFIDTVSNPVAFFSEHRTGSICIPISAWNPNNGGVFPVIHSSEYLPVINFFNP